MTISLSPATQKLLEDRLNSGGYGSADEIVHAALEALAEAEVDELDEATLDALEVAEKQVDRGEVYNWKDIRDEVRARLTQS
jgi:putative addiction module CopG family antidote